MNLVKEKSIPFVNVSESITIFFVYKKIILGDHEYGIYFQIQSKSYLRCAIFLINDVFPIFIALEKCITEK